MTPDHRTQIELVPIDGPARRPSEQIPHPRARYFEVPVGTDNLSSTIPHVDNVTYLRWIDRIAELAGDALGHSRMALAEQDRMWFVAKHEIDYLAETFAGDAVRAATWIHDARKTGCRRDTLLWRDTEGRVDVLARARTTWAWIDLTRRRPCRMPQDVIDRLDALHSGPLESSRGGRP